MHFVVLFFYFSNFMFFFFWIICFKSSFYFFSCLFFGKSMLNGWCGACFYSISIKFFWYPICGNSGDNASAEEGESSYCVSTLFSILRVSFEYLVSLYWLCCINTGESTNLSSKSEFVSSCCNLIYALLISSLIFFSFVTSELLVSS